MRVDSVSETRTASSTNPACFFRMGRTLSLMVSLSSRAFPGLQVSSTTLVYTRGAPFVRLEVKGTRRGATTEMTCRCFDSYGTPALAEGQLPQYLQVGY